MDDASNWPIQLDLWHPSLSTLLTWGCPKLAYTPPQQKYRYSFGRDDEPWIFGLKTLHFSSTKPTSQATDHSMDSWGASYPAPLIPYSPAVARPQSPWEISRWFLGVWILLPSEYGCLGWTFKQRFRHKFTNPRSNKYNWHGWNGPISYPTMASKPACGVPPEFLPNSIFQNGCCSQMGLTEFTIPKKHNGS